MDVTQKEKEQVIKQLGIPWDEESDRIELSANSLRVLARRYLRKDMEGRIIESPAQMFRRVAYHVAKADLELGGDEEDVKRTTEKFYEFLTAFRFMPNSPTFTGAGTPLGQLAACFVLPISDDMGKEPDGIFMTLRNAALIQQTGGGNGFSFSRLRPRGDRVSTSSGTATGPVGFLKVYDVAFGEIAQGGCLVPETLVFTEQGTLRLDEIVDPHLPGWQPHHMRVATDMGWRSSPRGYNNGVKPVLRVRTAEGLEITGTPDHKVKVMTPEGPQWRPLSALQPGDAILVKLGQHRGTPQRLVHPEREHGNQVMPQFPQMLGEDLAFFVGYLLGDGFIARGEHDHRLGVSVAHSSYLLEEMPRLIRRLFGEDVRVHRQQKRDDASVTLVLDNRALKEFFLLNGITKPGSVDVSVPQVIRRSPREVVAAFLRGLFEADGTVTHGYPELITTSERLAREVATLLIGLGMPVSLQQMVDGGNHLGTAARWRLRVVSHRGLDVWREVIGCDPRSRFAAVCAFNPDLQREQSYPLPAAEYWLNPVLEAITLPQVDRQGRGQGKKFRSTAPALRRRLLRYVRGERQLTLSAYEALMDAYAVFREHAPTVDDLWFVHVTSVEEAGERLTLDLEVDENHTYLAWGLVTHNTRRGANMGVLRVDHPDIFDFIRAKEKEGELTNFNLSVGITDEFMRAVEEDREFDLVNPRDGKVWRTVRAREIFDEIVRHAHYNGEPGALFLDTANRTNPLPHLYELEATNPCGEQFLGPYENCCLGSINLAKHVKEVDGKRVVDWDLLQDTVERAVHFLDNVVTANAYVPAVPQLKEAAHKARRIGLGIMGLGDIMYDLGVRYGSEEGQEFAAQIMEFIRYHAMRKSIELARERGAFPAIKGSIYDPEDLKWRPPEWPDWLGGGPRHDWGRPPLDWEGIVEGIKRYGIRNAAQLTVAPTGTIATVSGCEGYGCEPVFALAYIRHFKDEDRDVELEYVSPRFLRALEEAHLDEETKRRIIDEVFRKGTCQGIEELPEEIRHVFVVAQDITAEEHVRMQAALQVFVDNSISKTINFPETATVNDVANAYKLAWKLGCKGITVYVTGSREQVVLETREVKEKKMGEEAKLEPSPVLTAESREAGTPAAPPWNGGHQLRPRPSVLAGRTYRRPTPVGTAWITVNYDEYNEPFEVFLNVGKAGSDVAADSEALGRLISLILRLPSPLSPRERLEEVVHQLSGIGGGRSMGFGAQRVRSLPDAIAQVLRQYLEQGGEPTPPPQQLSFTLATPVAKEEPESHDTFEVYGDICPECGQATLIPFEGCKRCTNCGYSEC